MANPINPTNATAHPKNRSTGPTSIPGKRQSSMNALKTGIYAKTKVLPFEDQRAYDQHIKAIANSLHVQNPLEENLAIQAGDAMWRAQRQEGRLDWERKKICAEMTASYLAEYVTRDSDLIQFAPDFILDASTHFSKKELKHYRFLYEEHRRFRREQVGIVSSYEPVWQEYRELFEALAPRVDVPGGIPLFNSYGQLHSHWAQTDGETEHALLKYSFWLWWAIHFEQLKPQLMKAYHEWYLTKTWMNHRLPQMTEAILREQKLGQGALDAIFKLRRGERDQSQWVTRMQEAPLILKNELLKSSSETDD